VKVNIRRFVKPLVSRHDACATNNKLGKPRVEIHGRRFKLARVFRLLSRYNRLTVSSVRVDITVVLEKRENKTNGIEPYEQRAV